MISKSILGLVLYQSMKEFNDFREIEIEEEERERRIQTEQGMEGIQTETEGRKKKRRSNRKASVERMEFAPSGLE